MHSKRQLDTVQTQEQLLQRLVTYSCLINTVCDRSEFFYFGYCDRIVSYTVERSKNAHINQTSTALLKCIKLYFISEMTAHEQALTSTNNEKREMC